MHAFTFASNHFHLLVWARGAALACFMEYLRANLSKKVGRRVDGSGGFWERRYSAEPVLDDTALVGGLRYVLAHGVKEGLVERSARVAGPHVPAATAGACAQALPVVQLEQALEQTQRRGRGGGGGALRGGMG